jgi:uncharacterized protein YdeI (YjbR/CyaY-like superfamily)
LVKKTEKLYLTERDAWRAWLKKHHKTKKEIWLIYYKKHTGKPRIPYEDAVEEALCFDWIDSTVKKLDNERYAQKFTPRSSKSKWSELNIKRAKKMIKAGRMTRAGLLLFKEVDKYGKKGKVKKPPTEELVIPDELKKELAKDKKAQENFDNFAPGYRRLYIGWITSAKKEETKGKRICRVVEWAGQNKKPGML